MQALRAFRALAAVACVDGKISQPEMQLLVRKAREVKLDPAEVQEILVQGREGKLPYALPAEPREFEERFGDVIDIVCADGRIETQERMLLLRFAGRAGIVESDLMARLRPKLQAAQERLAGASGPRPPEQVVSAPAPLRRTAPDAPRPTLHAPRPQAPPEPRPPLDTARSASVPVVRPAPASAASIAPAPVSGPVSLSGSDDRLGNRPMTMAPPGPVTLGGPSPLTAAAAEELSPVTLLMVKSQLHHGTIEEAVRYLQNFAGIKDDAEARRIVEKVMRENPELRAGKR